MGKLTTQLKAVSLGSRGCSWLASHLWHVTTHNTTLSIAQHHHSTMALCRDNILMETPGLPVFVLALLELFWSESGHPPSWLLILLEGLAAKTCPTKAIISTIVLGIPAPCGHDNSKILNTVISFGTHQLRCHIWNYILFRTKRINNVQLTST